jgi:antitoxin (DNA-binding transcriptional repressor) of toxin-antitoxin stability system
MLTAQVNELKDRIDEVIRAVRQGEIVDILEGAVSVAEVVPSIDTLDPGDSTLGQYSKDLATQRVNQDPQTLFEANLPLIDAVITNVCQRYAFSDADTKNFAAAAKRKLSANDYAVFRKFQYTSALPTYLTVVLRRYMSQEMITRRRSQETRNIDYERSTENLAQTNVEASIEKLVLEGKARKGTGELPADFFTRPLPKAKKSVLEQLLEDRRTGR